MEILQIYRKHCIYNKLSTKLQYSKHKFSGIKLVFQNSLGVGISEKKFLFRYILFLQTTNIVNLPQLLQIHQTNAKFAILQTQLLRKQISFPESP